MTLKKQLKLAKLNGTYEELRDNLIQQKIRERYPLHKELAIERKRYTEPVTFQEFYDYVEQCIREVDALLDQA